VVEVDGALPQGAAKVRAVRAMFDTVAPRYDLVNRLMTFGLDRRWRRATVASLGLGPGQRVLDVACGTGDLCDELRAARYAPVGIDLSIGMLRHTHGGAPLVQGDALRLPFPTACFDGAVSGFALRNFAELPAFFDELARVLRPGGHIGLLDVSTPANPVMRAGHRLWFERAVPKIGGALSDAEAYRYLPRSVAYLPPVPAILDCLRTAGFASVQRHALSGGITQLFNATREAL
jgi:demethylmenaquinone methyltransferase/2-methoxy-6-polyprenyl-1,4-benzoquinol methylase